MRYLFLFLLLSILVIGVSVQELINSAPPNSTVYIPPGYYKERLVIEKPLRIVGVGWPVIDGGGIGDVIYVNNTWVELEGLVVAGSGTLPENAGIKTYNSWVFLRNVVVNSSYNGVYLVMSRGVIDNVTVIGLGLWRRGAEQFGQLFHEGGYHVSGFEDRGHGFYVFNSSVVIRRSSVLYSKDGVYLEHSYDVVIRDSKFLSGRYGTHLMYSRRVEIVNNTYMYNLVGILLMYSQNLYVFGNRVLRNRGVYVSEGITLIECDNVIIERNTIAFHIYGVNVRYTPWRVDSYFYVRNNTVAFNYYGAVFDIYSGGNFTSNIFLDNMIQLGTTGTTRRVNTKFFGNYWSDYRGDGDVPYVYVSPLSDLSELRLALRFFAFGPSTVVMQYMKLELPVYARLEFVDPAPRRFQGALTGIVFSYEFVAVGVVLLMPFAVVWLWTRRWW
jgi:nitrous oxidase accessory protein